MSIYIAFLRGINVGGRSMVSKAELIAAVEAAGGRETRTYIQSGNVVFVSDEQDQRALGTRIAEAVNTTLGFEPYVHVLTIDELRSAVAGNPFREGESEPKALHLLFLKGPATGARIAELEAIRLASERFHLTDAVFYLHAPDGVGRSKLAASAERLLSVAATGRNWRTVCTVLEMAEA